MNAKLRDLKNTLLNFSRLYARNRSGIFGMVILAVFIFMYIFGPYIAPYNPTSSSSWLVAKPFSAPQWYSWFDPSIPKDKVFGYFGSDEVGRDVYSQLIYGTRISLTVGLLAATVATFTGLFIGLISGYYGRILDTILMRITDLLLVLPWLPLIIVVAAILGPGLWNIVAVIGLTGWTWTARMIRSQVLSLKESEYVAAAKVSGVGDGAIMFRHILPNVIPLTLAQITLGIAQAILIESGLSFIGLGSTESISWGQMLYYAQTYGAALNGAWWLIFFPGVCITLVVVSFTFVGRSLNETFNPRLRVRA